MGSCYGKCQRTEAISLDVPSPPSSRTAYAPASDGTTTVATRRQFRTRSGYTMEESTPDLPALFSPTAVNL